MPGRVHEQRAAWQLEQLAMRRRVAATRVRRTNRRGRLAILAQQRVDERRLPDARRTEDGRGRARVGDIRAAARDPRPSTPRPATSARRARRLDRDEPPVDVVGEVGLVEDDDRRDAARPGDRQVALDAPEVEVVVEARDEQRDVDVGGHDLLVVETGSATAAVGGHPPEDAAARQDRARPRRRHRATTQSPTVGKSERGERCEPERARHDRRPVAGSRRARSRSPGGRRRRAPDGAPRPRCGSKAVAQPASQPSPVRVSSGSAIVISADPLQLAGALGVSLGAAERPEPERDEDDRP